ncbi:putative membrane protein [Actinobacteria bacterium IMCC26256]|jgi:membrane protein|nr:putative membrane protein [Actinobacteria bacterium IMCC26256]
MMFSEIWSLILAVAKKFSEKRGSNLAAAIAFRAFLGLFACLVLSFAIAGYLNASGRAVSESIIRNLGLSGDAAKSVSNAVKQAQSSRATTTIFGLLGLVWTGTGLSMAIAYAWNSAWGIPGGGLRGRASGVLWMLGSGACILVAVGSTSWIASHHALPIIAIIIGITSDLILVLLTAVLLPARHIPLRWMLPAVIVTSIGLSGARFAGATVLPLIASDSSAIYGTLGVFFALLIWMLVIGYVLVTAAMVEVIIWERTHGTVDIKVLVPRPHHHLRRRDAVRESKIDKTS